MKWAFRGAVLVVLGAAGIWLWSFLFPPPERVIRRRIAELQQVASFDSREAPLAKLANAQKFAGFFTPDVRIVVDLPGQRGTLTGRDELFQRDLGVRNALSGLDVKLLDVNVNLVKGGEVASVNLTATAKIPGEHDIMVQEMELTMVKNGRDWLIRQVETVRTLK